MLTAPNIAHMLFYIAILSAPLVSKLSIALPLSTPLLYDIEYPEDEPPSEDEIYLGKLLFFDHRLSGNNNVSCATCHNPDHGFSDGLKLSIGTEGNKLTRHTPHLYNLAWSNIFFWDGRADSLEHQALMPITNPEEMNLSETIMLSRIAAIQLYQAQFTKVYGKIEIDKWHISRALASFMRSIVSNNSSFDKYLAGQFQALSPEARNGLKLFEGKAKCTECHDGANFSDDSFHSLGIATTDKGRGTIINEPEMAYRFKTPSLRNVALTNPYMHDGSLADLEAVIQFYNEGGGDGPNKDVLMKPLNLTQDEVRDLISFLSALTDPVLIVRPVFSEINLATSKDKQTEK